VISESQANREPRAPLESGENVALERDSTNSAPLAQAVECAHELQLERRADGKLWATLAGKSAVVEVKRCFPWTQPNRYFSLRESEETEFAFVSDPERLSQGSRKALERSLLDAGFVFVITRIESIEEDFELRCFKVETPQGPRAFQTALDAWPRETPEGDLLIQDVAGDLFLIPRSGNLDAKSRELVWALVD
jgi:hypothetical protein